jgi:hypothetical protein
MNLNSESAPVVPVTPTKLYKVLNAEGRSFHGGDFQFSLPKDGNPGDWHEVEGEVVLCQNGFHLTDDPASWWGVAARCFLVESEGVVGDCKGSDRKCAAKKVRLIRELTNAELAEVRIFKEGAHTVSEGATYWAYDSATVRASGSATVEASGSATVRAYDSATVRASGSATVEASGSATVRAYDSATVEASGSATVRASGSATVEASGSATVRAYDSATVRASGSATVRAYGSATVEASGSATVEASGQTTVVSWKGKDGIKVIEQAVCIVRSWGSAPEVVLPEK